MTQFNPRHTFAGNLLYVGMNPTFKILQQTLDIFYINLTFRLTYIIRSDFFILELDVINTLKL